MAQQQQESGADELFEVKNQFILGNFQQAINECNLVKSASSSVKVLRDCYLYRCYIAQKKYSLVLSEIKPNAPAQLLAVRSLAEFLQDTSKGEDILTSLKQLVSTNVEPIILLIIATVYYHLDNYDDALRVIHDSRDLECMALVVQLYLRKNRLQHAVKQLTLMKSVDDDATLTQLAEAWVDLSLGGKKYDEAYFIFQELVTRYSVTLKLLNGQALCRMHMGKFSDAHDLLLEALERNNSDPDTLANLIVCLKNMNKSSDVVQRYLTQLKESEPNHPFVTELSKKEYAFDRAAVRFQPSVSASE